MANSDYLPQRGDAMNQPVIVLEDVSKVFDNGTKALDGIDLRIDAGETVILNGISGSGKTTLVGLIAALDRPTHGLVEVAGLKISKLPQVALDRFRQRGVGVVFQDFGLIEYLSVFENVVAPLIPLNLDKKLAEKRVREAMQQANISHKADTKVSLLSGGEKQRCAIARALVNEPKVLICDEPTANLDLENSKVFIAMITDLRDKGYTVIISTHDPVFAEMMHDIRIVTLSDGNIKES